MTFMFHHEENIKPCLEMEFLSCFEGYIFELLCNILCDTVLVTKVP